MLIVSIAKYLPQIRRILRSRSVIGLAPAAYYGDSLVFCTKSMYHFRRGHPVTAWGELLVIFAQNVVISGLIHAFREPSAGAKAACRDIAIFLAFVFALTRLPSRFLPLLSLFTAPLLVMSYSAQLLTNMQRKSTGQLSPGTVLLRLFGSTVRSITTITQLGGELPVLINHAIGVGGCTLLLLQIWWFGAKTPAEERPLALPPPADPWSFQSVTLMWRSLGGFRTDEKRPPSQAQLRAAFDRIDTAGEGFITFEEVVAALAVSNPAVTSEGAQRMMTVADDNDDQTIDFQEFERMILLSGLYVRDR